MQMELGCVLQDKGQHKAANLGFETLLTSSVIRAILQREIAHRPPHSFLKQGGTIIGSCDEAL